MYEVDHALSQRYIDEARIRYALSPSNGGAKTPLAVFANKTDFSLIKVCYKVSLCYNICNVM